ncbi:MAG: hypothetical protein Ct9H90mP23_0550 [Methanobacteriota archaeon]|nr:MAG: hypothetical protein Ct9H90mP23_0550 [Euryarchaeota archaeon]
MQSVFIPVLLMAGGIYFANDVMGVACRPLRNCNGRNGNARNCWVTMTVDAYGPWG